MKRFILSIICLLCSSAIIAQTDYKVVFDLTSGDTAVHKTVLRQAKGIATERPDAQIAVVIYSDALNFVLKDKSVNQKAVEELLQNKNVSFKVCAATMKRHKADPSQLISGVQPVPDGIYEIITKQREGWGYIKVAQ